MALTKVFLAVYCVVSSHSPVLGQARGVVHLEARLVLRAQVRTVLRKVLLCMLMNDDVLRWPPFSAYYSQGFLSYTAAPTYPVEACEGLIESIN